jgi:hypothetical protein
MKDHWVHIPDSRTYPLAVNHIVDGAFLRTMCGSRTSGWSFPGVMSK